MTPMIRPSWAGSRNIWTGSIVVTGDTPAGVVAVGNPCRVLRQVGEHDKFCCYKDRKVGCDYDEQA